MQKFFYGTTNESPIMTDKYQQVIPKRRSNLLDFCKWIIVIASTESEFDFVFHHQCYYGYVSPDILSAYSFYEFLPGMIQYTVFKWPDFALITFL